MTTAIDCPHCDRRCAGPAGLASHIRSLHPEILRAREQQLDRDLPPEAPRAPVTPASNGLVWEDPPSRGGDTTVNAIVALMPELRRNPGRWARVYTWANKTGANTTQTKLRKDARVSDCEFAARSDSKAGTSALYGRYIEAE